MPKQTKNKDDGAPKAGHKEAGKSGPGKNEPNPATEAQETILRHSFFKNQLDASVQELRNLEMIKADYATAKRTLDTMKDMSSENEGLIPIGANILLKSKVSDKDNVLVDIGSNVVIKKSVPEAIARVDSLWEDLNAREKELADNIQFSRAELDKVAPKMQELQRQASR